MRTVLRNYWWVSLMLASMAVTFYAYDWALKQWWGFNGPDAVTLATLLLVSISLHEFGHWVVMNEYGLRPYMFIMVLLGGAGPANAEEMKKLPRRQLVNILLAGPAANFGLMLVGLLTARYTTWEELGMALAHINAGLIVFNLLPFGPLDGGRFARLLFDSLDERTDQLISRIGAAVAVVIAIVGIGTGHFSLYPALLVTGVLRASTKDDPEAWREPRSMHINGSWTSFVIWLVMWGAAMALYLYLPNWVTQYPRT